MQVPIFKLAEQNGYSLYRREKTKEKGCASWPKYFIKDDDSTKKYFKEFRTLPQAKKEFKELTTPVKETEPAPTPTSKEGLEDSEIRVYGIDSNLHDGKIFDLTNNDFVHIAEEQGYVWTLAGFESAFNSEEIAYDMFIRFINPVKEQL